MKKVLMIFLSIALIFTMAAPTFAADNVNDKFAELKAAGVLDGDANGNMLPAGEEMERQQLAKIANTLVGNAATPGVDIPAFADDYKDGVWGFEQGWIQAAYTNGLMVGKGDAGFDARGTVTWAELLTVVLRAAGFGGELDNNNWKDSAVQVALAKGFITASVDPDAVATYGDLVNQVYNSYEAIQAQNVLAVESVTQLNAGQFKVVFNKAVDEDTAETKGNYSIDGTPLAGLFDLAELQGDGKSVIVSLNSTTAFVNGTAYKITVSGVKDASGVALAKAYSTSILASDTVAPTVFIAAAKAKVKTKSATLVFSEPIDASVGSVTVNGQFATVTALPANKRVVSLTTTSDLVVGSTYALSIMNFKDLAGNVLDPNPSSFTLSVTEDVTGPELVSAAFTSETNIQLVFNEDVDIATLTANTSVKILDSNLALVGGAVTGIAAKGSSKTTYNVTVGALPYNASNVFNGTLVLTNAIKDVSGNAFAGITQGISVNKDVVAPQITNVSYKNVTTYNTIATPNGAIVVTFNEPVALGTATAAAYTAITNSGTVVTAPAFSAVAINPNNDKELVVNLSANVAPGVTSYLVLIPGNAVKDLAQTPNVSVAGNYTVDMTAGAPVASDVTKPVYAFNTVVPSNTGNSTIAVDFTEAGSGLKFSTVVDTNNYKLDGLPLPAGSYITVATVSPVTTATINIPNGTIATDKTYILNITGVSDMAGNVIVPVVDVTNVVLRDNVAPVLTSGVVNVDGTMTLGYSEDIDTTGPSVNNYTVMVDGAPYTPSAIAVITAGADTGKVLMTPAAAGDFTSATSIIVKTVSGTTTIDDVSLFGNEQKLNTTIIVK